MCERMWTGGVLCVCGGGGGRCGLLLAGCMLLCVLLWA